MLSRPRPASSGDTAASRTSIPWTLLVNVSLVSSQSDAYVALMSNDTLINADIWDDEPKIFTAPLFRSVHGLGCALGGVGRSR